MEQITEYIKSQDIKYPNRHKEIHASCCKNCPTEHDVKNGISDPETEDIAASYPKEVIAKKFLFVCAWRPSKLCKGLCDYFGVDERYIESVNLEEVNQ